MTNRMNQMRPTCRNGGPCLPLSTGAQRTAFLMHDLSYYRRRAAELRGKAVNAESDDHCASYLRLAHTWDQLADDLTRPAHHKSASGSIFKQNPDGQWHSLT
jgi:hypothetical protein